MPHVLPRVLWSMAFEYSFESVVLEGRVFPMYEYVENTFAKNINHIKNENTLRTRMECAEELQKNKPRLVELQERKNLDRYEEDELDNLKMDLEMFHDLIGIITDTDNIGMLKHLRSIGKLDSVMVVDLFMNASLRGSFEILQYIVKNTQAISVYKMLDALGYARRRGYLKIEEFLVKTLIVCRRVIPRR